MKKKYETPLLDLQIYELNADIAQNCNIVVTTGPEDLDHEACDDYMEIEGISTSRMRTRSNVDFWDNCDCYTSASGDFFTS
ncbi:MAG: hypothetical protein ACI3W5_09295 [Faecousia sp.]